MSPYCPLGSHGLGGAVLCVYSVSCHEKVFAPFLMSSGFCFFFLYIHHTWVFQVIKQILTRVNTKILVLNHGEKSHPNMPGPMWKSSCTEHER